MGKAKKFLSLILVVMIIIPTCSLSFFTTATSTIKFQGGNGTKDNPYQIATPEQLNAVRYDLTAYYEQVADIDMSDWGNWEPIGKAIPLYSTTGSSANFEENLFSGSYNGNDYIINNLKITDDSISPHYDCYGLFAGAENSTLSNIRLQNLLIDIDKSTTDYVTIYETERKNYSVTVGGIVGKACDNNDSVSIINCDVTGSISIYNCCDVYVGGISGSCNIVNKCLNKANINVVANKKARFPDSEDSINNHIRVGGIVGGSAYGPLIEECCNTGNISCYGDSIHLGGIIGRGNTIRDCVNQGDLKANYGIYQVGGIAGYVNNSIENSINYGNIYAHSTLYLSGSQRPGVGGVLGDGTASVMLKSCYNKSDIIHASDEHDYFTACLIGECNVIAMINCFSINSEISTGVIDSHKGFSLLTNDDFIIKSTYIDFDFDNIWKIDSDVGGAVLKSHKSKNIYNLGEETYSFNNYGDSDSRGHCFGMSMTSSGYHLGLLDPSNVGATSSQEVYGLSDTLTVRVPICNYQAIQGSYRDYSMVAGGSYYKNGIYNIDSDWEEVINYVKNHNYDNTGTLQIGYRKSGRGGHAINFLRYEVVDGQERIYAYDNNFPDIETYFYKDSNGSILQAPEQTFSGSIDCITLRDVNKYFSIIEKVDRILELIKRLSVYAEKDMISIEVATAYPMEGAFSSAEYYMYELPEDTTIVRIKPLVENATFTYMEQEYRFSEINEDTYAEFTLSTSEEDTPEFKIINAPEDEPENEPCSCNCHKGGISGFFFKLINFFEKLFGKNKVCACGVKH